MDQFLEKDKIPKPNLDEIDNLNSPPVHNSINN